MPFAYAPIAKTGALFDKRWRTDGQEATSYPTRLTQHSSLQETWRFETTPFTYGHGNLAIGRGIVTAVLFLAACITTAVAGGMVWAHASDHDPSPRNTSMASKRRGAGDRGTGAAAEDRSGSSAGKRLARKATMSEQFVVEIVLTQMICVCSFLCTQHQTLCALHDNGGFLETHINTMFRNF